MTGRVTDQSECLDLEDLRHNHRAPARDPRQLLDAWTRLALHLASFAR